MNNIQILSYNEVMMIVIASNATEFEPQIMKSGALYDATTFKPINPKPKQKMLTPEHQQMAKDLINEARSAFKDMMDAKAKAQASQPAPAQPAPAPAKVETKTPQTTLDSLIAESVAKLSLSSVLDTAKPILDKYIVETYGMMPKKLDVTSHFGTHEVKGMTCKEFDTALKLVEAQIPVFLSGPAGCGKNVMCKQIAEALGLDFYFSNAVTQEYKITGFIDANGHYNDTQFFKAFTEGGLFMLDEIDASSPEVLVLLNSALANGYMNFPTGKFDAHENFRIVAAGNTYGTGADAEYTGRYQLDASSLDRFAILDVTYDRNIEKALAGGDDDILDFIWNFRKAVKKSNINFTVSYRAVERLTKMIQLFDIDKAIDLAIIRGLEGEDVKMVANNMTNTTNKYTTALRKMYC